MALRIDEIRLTHVRVPLHEPFVISSGSVAEKDAILVELIAAGLAGIGEASPMAGSFYSRHTPEGCWDTLVNRLIPLIQGAGRITPRTLLAISESLDDPFARSGVETAAWDALARAEGRPLWQLLGGSAAATVESGLAVGIYHRTDMLVERIGRYLRQDGYRRVKIKVQPGWDVEPLEAVRAAWPDVPLMVDANAAYRREHIDHIASWDRFGLMMIEQPLPADDLDGHAALASRCRTPICLDESATSARVVRDAIGRGAAGIINIKLQRVGGFTAALDIHNAARAAFGLAPVEIHAALACGDAIAYVRREMQTKAGLAKKYTFSGSVYFEHMQKQGLYTTDVAAIRARVEKAGMTGAFARRLG
ncbi:MAG TPA: enolase C-terminal domain-like protein [Phycisphaerae bacterium]|nr:enolase C-terminal domain-like protein [Phycisphaerae bacterium]